MPKIAVIGGGFSGLAVSYHLLKKLRGGNLTFFEEGEGENSASKIAAGLLHPYSMKRARLMWKGKEAFKAALLLIEKASYVLCKEVMRKEGVLRLAVDEFQEKHFPMRAEEDKELSFWTKKQVAEKVQGVHCCGGLFMNLGVTVNPKLYLEGLRAICLSLGAARVKKKVSLKELENFDILVLAVGGSLFEFEPCQSLKMRRNKGQLLICKKPASIHLPFSLLGKGYLILNQKEKQCYLGASYESTFTSKKANLQEAIDRIMPKARCYLRSASSFMALDCQAALRVFCPRTYLPRIGRLVKKIWFIGAMGSRGLLYHSYLGHILSQAIIKDDEKVIPEEVRL